MILKKSSLAFEREGLQIRIEGLWTYVCPNGHESVPGPVAINVMNLVDQVFKATQHLQQAVNLPSPVINVLFPTTEGESAQQVVAA
jgi:hypothetical protein